MPEAITVEEWLAELTRLGESEQAADGYLTAAGIVQATGRSSQSIGELLRAAQAAGRLEVRKIREVAVDGVMRSKPAYRVTPPPAPAKRKGRRK